MSKAEVAARPTQNVASVTVSGKIAPLTMRAHTTNGRRSRPELSPGASPTKATLGLVVGLLCTALVAGCKKQDDLQDDENLKVVVATDHKLAKKEQELLARRGNLQRRRMQIRDKRAALRSRLLQAEGNPRERRKIKKEQTRLVKLETKILEQEADLNKRISSLLQKKGAVIEKAGKEKRLKGVLLARREYSVSLREKEVARREREIAQRERTLATREAAFAKRQAKLCPGRTIVQTIAAPQSDGKRYSRKEAEPLYKRARKLMGKKGIIVADLPAGVGRLVKRYARAMRKHDYTTAKYAADQLLASVRGIRIDRSFIGGKIARLSHAIKRRPPKGGSKARVRRLFQKATAAYGDGRFKQANRLLNRIYGLLG